MGARKKSNRAVSELQQTNVAVLASAISAILGTGAVHQPAHAQDELEEVTVTGSRIVRRDLTASSPIMTIESTQFEQSSTLSLESVLNQMPQFVPADTQYDSSTQTSSFGTPGIATVDLRGLGTNRNLVLVDGRRAQPANATLVVDVNTIPAAAIERVETITGGASAVYGADALAGVVNFILRDDFEGVELDMQTGQTVQSDGEESSVSALIGVNTDDGRGNAMLGLGWYKREAVRQWDREFFREGFRDPDTQFGGFLDAPGFSPAGNPPDQAAVDQVFQEAHGVAPGTVSSTSEIYFNPDGTPFLLNGLGYTGPLQQIDINGQGYHGVKVQPDGSLAQSALNTNYSEPMERRSVFGRARYDVGDNLTAFVQANYSNVEVRQRAGWVPAITVWQAPIPNDGQRDIPDALQTLLDSRQDAAADWNLFRGLDFLGNEQTRNRSDVYQIMGGIEGSFPEADVTYEAYVSAGRTDILSLGQGFGSLQRYQLLVSQPGFGQVDQLTRGANYSISCPTGLPIFGGENPAPSCLEAIEAKLKFLTNLDQNIAETNFQGRIADMPAGELRFAAGASWRENKFRHEPPEIVDNVAVVEQPMGLFVSNNALGETLAKEVYGELLIPATERVDFELGYRLSDFDTAGTVDTWKGLANWRPTDAISIRGGFQSATRAPNTAELFAQPTLQTVGFGPSDPCSYTTLAPWGNVPENPDRQQVQDLCRQLINRSDSDPTNDGNSAFDTNPDGPDGFARPGLPFFPLENEIVMGNEELGTEEADTFTLGLVLDGPGELDNFVTSIDYYNIQISNAIAPIDSVFVYAQCFNANGTSNPDYVLDDPGGFCDLIQRFPERGTRRTVDAPYSNTGALETEGVDLTVNWTADFGPGSFNVNSVANILERYETQENPQTDIIDSVGTLNEGGHFDYRLFTRFSYTFGAGTTVGVNWRHLPSIEAETAAEDPNTRIRGVDSYNMFDLYARYALTDRMEFRGGVDNLLDEAPPVVGADPGTETIPVNANRTNTNPEFYDVLGRRFYVGLKLTF